MSHVGDYFVIHEVHPRIFICSEEMAECEELIKKNNIQAISCETPARPQTQAMYRRLHIDYYHIDIQDELNYEIQRHFTVTNQILKTHLERKQNILVHCVAGVSRSPTLVAAYLLSIGWMDSASKVLQYLQQSRKMIDPNEGFVLQLATYYTNDA